MSIDPKLQSILDKSGDNEILDVVFILDAGSIEADSAVGSREQILAARKQFADQAEGQMVDIIQAASKNIKGKNIKGDGGIKF